MAMVCANVRKTYGTHTVLRDVNLTLEPGKIYGLLGRNGVGKTTLLSLMSNQAPLSGGSITLDGEPVWENRKAISRICFSRELNVSSEGSLGGYTLKKYLATAAEYLPHWDQKMADKLLALFRLDKKKRLGTFSKGMLSAVTILIALASKAEYTFLDEPVAGLDVVAREQFYRLLLQEYADTGRTFVISTHILEEASDLMEEVILLKDGGIVLKENTQSLLQRACQVSGLDIQVDEAVRGLTQYRPEILGRRKSVTVLLGEGECVKEGLDVTVQPVSLQKLFSAICGEDAL